MCRLQLVQNKEIEEYGTDRDWTNVMDRGGLFHFNE